MRPGDKTLKGTCTHCGMPLEFPALSIGLRAPCRFCGQQTELLLARPPQEPAVPRRLLVWSLIAVVILVFGLVASLVALNWLEKKQAEHQKRRSETPSSASPRP